MPVIGEGKFFVGKGKFSKNGKKIEI